MADPGDGFKDHVLCTCPQCSTNTRINADGIEIRGLMVHNSTRKRHRIQASANIDEACMLQMFPNLSVNRPEPVPVQVTEAPSSEEDEQPTVSPNEIISKSVLSLLYDDIPKLTGSSKLICRFNLVLYRMAIPCMWCQPSKLPAC